MSAAIATAAVGAGTRRVIRGVAANVLGQMLQAAGQLLLIPLYLAAWGVERYGEWLVLTAAATQFLMLDFGLQMFALNQLTQQYARRDWIAYRRTFQSGFALSCAISAAAALVLLPLLAAAPLDRMFGFKQTSRAAAMTVGFVLTAQVLGSIPYGLLGGVYRSTRQYPRAQMTENVKTVLLFGAAAILLAAGGSLVGVAAGQLCVMAAVFAFVWIDLRRRYPELALFAFDAADRRAAFSLLGPSSLFFLIQASNALSVQGGVMAVGAAFGAASVAVFVPLRTLANLVRQAGTVVHNALWPELTSIEALGDYARLRRLFLLISTLLVTVAACAVVFLHLSAADIVAFWTGGRLHYDPAVMTAFLFVVVAQATWSTAAVVLASASRHRIVAICSALSAGAGLALGLALARWFGLAGFVHGLWIAELTICGVPISYAACRFMRLAPAEFASRVLLKGALAGVAAYAVAAPLRALFASAPLVVRPMVVALATAAVGLPLAYAQHRSLRRAA